MGPPAHDRVALLFPGQGSQFPQMCVELHRGIPGIRAHVDQIFEEFGAWGSTIRRHWLDQGSGSAAGSSSYSQPLLFTLDLALGRFLIDSGVRPWALLGHSIGELAAATLAGVFELGAAVHLVGERTRHIEQAPGGGMVAVAGSAAEVGIHLNPHVNVAAVNAPRQTIIAGPTRPLRQAVERLRSHHFSTLAVASDAPFHSPALQSVADATEELVQGIHLHASRIPMVSGYTGDWLTAQLASTPQYWARHVVESVQYWQALDTLFQAAPTHLVECGPGDYLTSLARRHPGMGPGVSVVAPAGRTKANSTEVATLLSVLTELGLTPALTR